MEVVSQLISSVGFPIVAFILLYLYIKERDKETNEERKLFTEAINNNTLAINNLASKISEGGFKENA